MSQHTIIAVDGPAASGKGTLARALAKELGFAYLDTGALYRCVGKAVLDAGGDPADEADAVAAAAKLSGTLKAEDTLDPSLRSDEMGQAASKVASFPNVRSALLDFQRRFAATPQAGYRGVILDGRDIGTVIAPQADVKLYVMADVSERANRRFKELTSKGIAATFDEVLADMRQRDERDTNRSIAPLKPAEDAVILDTTYMNANEALNEALRIVRDKAPKR